MNTEHVAEVIDARQKNIALWDYETMVCASCKLDSLQFLKISFLWQCCTLERYDACVQGLCLLDIKCIAGIFNKLCPFSDTSVYLLVILRVIWKTQLWIWNILKQQHPKTIA